MAADLTMAGWMRRQGLLLMDDHVVVLENDGYTDRIHRIFFDGVRSLVVWRTWPWGRMALYALLVGLPGVLAITAGYEGEIVGAILVAWCLIAEIRYAIYRRTTIRLQDGPRSRDFTVITRPSKVSLAVERLRTRIRVVQDQEIQRAAEREAERSPAPPAAAQESPQQPGAGSQLRTPLP